MTAEGVSPGRSPRRRPIALILAGLGVVLVVAAVVGAVAIASGSSDGGRASGAGSAASMGDAFYLPPEPLPLAAPGTLIRSEPLPAPAGARGWKVLYHSRALDGRDIAVSGVVYAPKGAAPAGGRDVVTYGHGTSGDADICAPSKWPDPAPGIPGLESLLRAGYVVAQTDYEGLGTPGVHPYLVGESEGRGMLDAARAVQHLTGARAGDRVVVDGHSQGGHAALFAGQIAPTYAPDLHVLGVSAGAPVTDVAQFLGSTRGEQSVKGFPMLAAAGYHAVYPEAPLDTLFSRPAIREIGAADRECDMNRHFAGTRYPILIAAPDRAEPWADLFAANSPGHVKSSIPIFVWQGSADPLVPEAATAEYVRRACALGDSVTYAVYAGADHGSVLTRARADVDEWIAARFAGTPVPPGCTTVQHRLG